MAIELKQQLRLSQQLVMTPQLQQAIKLLQLNQLELVNLVQQELQENPVLEENEVEEETQGERDDATLEESGDLSPSDGESDDRTDSDFSAGAELDGDGFEGASGEDLRELPDVPEFSFDEAHLAQDGAGLAEAPETSLDERSPSDADKIADVEWESYLDSHPMTGLDSKNMGDDERPSLEATYTRRPNLAEHLSWQLQVSELEPDELEIARWIVGNLDDQGYLRSTIEEVARLTNRSAVAVRALQHRGMAQLAQAITRSREADQANG